jgi:DNA-binding SARP family transcriptional activator
VEGAVEDRAARLAYGLRLLELEPTSEWAHRQVIQAHAENGDRASAISAYHRCVELLAADVGVEPTAETQALYERLVNGGRPRAVPVASDPPASGRSGKAANSLAVHYPAPPRSSAVRPNWPSSRTGGLASVSNRCISSS